MQVAVGPCDVNLSFGAHPAEISGRVRFLHPLHNFALVSYDPAQLPQEARSKVSYYTPCLRCSCKDVAALVQRNKLCMTINMHAYGKELSADPLCFLCGLGC